MCWAEAKSARRQGVFAVAFWNYAAVVTHANYMSQLYSYLGASGAWHTSSQAAREALER